MTYHDVKMSIMRVVRCSCSQYAKRHGGICPFPVRSRGEDRLRSLQDAPHSSASRSGTNSASRENQSLHVGDCPLMVPSGHPVDGSEWRAPILSDRLHRHRSTFSTRLKAPIPGLHNMSDAAGIAHAKPNKIRIGGHLTGLSRISGLCYLRCVTISAMQTSGPRASKSRATKFSNLLGDTRKEGYLAQDRRARQRTWLARR